MIRHLIHIVFGVIITGVFACGQNKQPKITEVVKDDYQPVYSSEQIKLRLEKLFEEKDTLALNEFFDEWNKSITPNSPEFINQNDTVRAVYDIFKEIYKPIEMQKIKQITSYLEDICESKYTVVQDKIEYIVMNADEVFIENKRRILWRDDIYIGTSINNFRPPLYFNSSKILYLTNEYNQALESFFSRPVTIYDSEVDDREERFNNLEIRIDFFKTNMPVLQWNFIKTFPVINHIIFDNNLTFAKVGFTLPHRGFTVYFCKEKNNWVIKDVVDSYTWD